MVDRRADLYSLLRPLLFRLDPETAHALAFRLLGALQGALERSRPAPPKEEPTLAQELFGLRFPNPIGLAAGLDKNADLPHVWAALGFGFAELGTITAQPQDGNPRPRIFRLTADRALINRLGFNNRGAEPVARRLAQRLSRHRPTIPLGINIGKSRAAAPHETIADYCASFRALFPLADYFAINVSSPNTPGLRDLQGEGHLDALLAALQGENARMAESHRTAPRPLLVKLAPDLSRDGLLAIVEVVRRRGAAGLIATNTTVQRPPMRSPGALTQQAGGLSGEPLRPLSTEIIRMLHQLCDGTLPIVGVGGIFTAADAYEKIRAGASLVQVYTALVYDGPWIVRRMQNGLKELLLRDGFHTVGDAVGR